MKTYLFLILFLLNAPCVFSYNIHTPPSPQQNKMVREAQADSAGSMLKVYLDCSHCDRNYIRSEIEFVSYVRDRTDADVHLLITRAHPAGGTEYTLKFLGKKNYKALSDTLTYFSPNTDSDEQERSGLVHRIKLGLIDFLMNKPAADQLTIGYDDSTSSKTERTRRDDPWNRWLFELEGDAWIDGQKTNKTLDIGGDFTAERITHRWKLHFYLGSNYHREKFELSEGMTTTHRNSQHYFGLVAYSLSPHWSIGAYSEANSSTFDNIDFSSSLSPALEYNIFPYSEYTEHELSIRYRISPNYRNYTHETIYLKQSELLLEEALAVRLEVIQPWGSVETEVNGSHFFHDVSFNRMNFNTDIEIKLLRGLSFDLRGGYSIINDQLSLPQKGSSDKDVLLNLREQATSYSYHLSVGLSYTFGTIFSNTVNTRL